MRIFFLCAFILCASAWGDTTQSKQSTCGLKVFGASPALNVLLEILYPEGMIGLSYKPYPEDIAFMPERIVNLPVLGISTKGTLNFEQIAKLKPDVIFFDEGTLDSLLEPYRKIGIHTIKLPSFTYGDYTKAIDIMSKALSVNESCKNLIEPRSESLLKFVHESNALLKDVSYALSSQEEQAKQSLRPRVYFALGFDGLRTQCGDVGDLAYQIGGVNAISCELLGNANMQSNINFELLAKVNPQVIFVREISFFNELVQSPSPKWQALQALQHKRVYYAPSTPSNWLINPPSILRSIGLVWAFAKTQPHLISEEVAKERAQSFYRRFLRELSEEDYLRVQGLL